VDAAGNILLAAGNRVTGGRVRAIAARTGTFYGQKMTAGHSYTVAQAGRLVGRAGQPPRPDPHPLGDQL
jgi:hypothetical protein